MTDTAKRLLIVGLVLISLAAGGYFYMLSTVTGLHEITDF
jgi:hypothetical protein